jgi:hypothetical protein
MAFKLRFALQAVFYAALVAYPALVFYLLVIREIPLRLFSVAICVFIARTSKKKQSQVPFCGLPSYCSVLAL